MGNRGVRDKRDDERAETGWAYLLKIREPWLAIPTMLHASIAEILRRPELNESGWSEHHIWIVLEDRKSLTGLTILREGEYVYMH